jgi:hypothetical protein
MLLLTIPATTEAGGVGLQHRVWDPGGEGWENWGA